MTTQKCINYNCYWDPDHVAPKRSMRDLGRWERVKMPQRDRSGIFGDEPEKKRLKDPSNRLTGLNPTHYPKS